jgi:hypothetical protein
LLSALVSLASAYYPYSPEANEKRISVLIFMLIFIGEFRKLSSTDSVLLLHRQESKGLLFQTVSVKTWKIKGQGSLAKNGVVKRQTLSRIHQLY